MTPFALEVLVIVVMALIVICIVIATGERND